MAAAGKPGVISCKKGYGGLVLAHGTTITTNSNLSDTSGIPWGCGGANCHIIDYLTGY